MSRKTVVPIAIVVVLVAALAIVVVVSIWNSNGESGPIRIGAVLPLSGPSARYGKWIQEGLDLAVDQINADGGVKGRSVEIIYEDDQAQPAMAASAMQKLVNIDKVPVVFGSWASSCVLAQAPIAERSKTVLIGEAISPKIREAGDYVFRIQPDARYYIRKLVPFVYEKMKARTASILYINNDFGVDQAKVFREAFEKLGGKVISEEAYLANATDFRAQLTKVKTKAPDVLFMPGYAEVGTILKQATELGLSCKYVGSVPTENPDLVKIAGQASEGVIYPSHFNPDSADAAVRNFQKAYEKKYGRKAEGYAALAYDGMRILGKALNECGQDSSCIKNYLYQTQYNGVTGKTSFDDKGDVLKSIMIKTVRKGRFTTISD